MSAIRDYDERAQRRLAKVHQEFYKDHAYVGWRKAEDGKVVQLCGCGEVVGRNLVGHHLAHLNEKTREAVLRTARWPA